MTGVLCLGDGGEGIGGLRFLGREHVGEYLG